MTDSIISVSAEAEFLSDVIDELPKNCLFNKGKVGCGGTTMALKDNFPTIVCVPYKSLIHNKVSQSHDRSSYPCEVFGFLGGASSIDGLSGYLMTASLPKIMVTYDSLAHVMSNMYLDPSKYNLLVDEYHCLLSEYSYRKDACRKVLDNFRAFKNYTFMTATPIAPEFLFDELKDIDVVTAVWAKPTKLTIKPVKCEISVDATVIDYIKRIFKHQLVGNHYFFVNSLMFIRKVIKNCGLDSENCRVIYSDSNTQELTIGRGKPSDPPKRINLITKTAFEGVDFMDEHGKIYVISDESNPHTKVDVSTHLVQISGRLRNSKYRDVLFHLFSTGFDSRKVTYAEFKQIMETKVFDEKELVASIRLIPRIDHQLLLAKKASLEYHRIEVEASEVLLDLNAQKCALYNYRIQHNDYTSDESLQAQYNIVGLEQAPWVTNTVKQIGKPVRDPSFKEVVIELEQLAIGSEDDREEYHLYLARANNRFYYLKDALEFLGFSGIRDLKYHTGNVQRVVIKRAVGKSINSDLIRVQQLLLLNSQFRPGTKISVDVIKRELEKCYGELGMNRKVTATEISTYFNVDRTTMMVKNEQQRAYIILSEKILEV